MKRDIMRSSSVMFLLILTSILVSFSIPEELSPVDITGSVEASFVGGNGTAENPYQISNVSQLQNMSADLRAHYTLINDIDASETASWNGGAGFTPISPDTYPGQGYGATPFEGSLEGQGFSISNLFQ